MADPARLYGLKALVTSAASGIGEAVARTLVKHGAQVFAVDGSNSGVEQHFKSVKGITGRSMPFTDAAALQDVIAAATDRQGGIDILVGEFPLHPKEPVAASGDGLDALLERRAELLETLAREALPELKKSPAGRIISIGMLRSAFAADAQAMYERAEANLAQLTRRLAAEAGEFGISANYVQPGAIMTPAARDVFRRDTTLRDHCIANSAARRLGEPVDVAKVVLFLASDDAMFVSGTGVTVDGGRLDG